MSAEPLRLAEPLTDPLPLPGARRALAHRALRSALATAFRALDVPSCTRLLGPIVPGATMPGGARVPGTSLELDPVAAACNLALLLHWQDARLDPTPLNALAGLLGVGDWLARRALMEGRRPLAVGELLREVMASHDLELELERALGPGVAPLSRLEVALTSGVGRLLGAPDAMLGTLPLRVQRARAADATDGAPRPAAHAADAHELAEASARAVRRALLHWKRAGSVARDGGSDPDRAAGAGMDAGTATARNETGDAGGAGACGSDDDGFAAAVARRFPAKQARTILAACADPQRLETCPVNAFVALLVTN